MARLDPEQYQQQVTDSYRQHITTKLRETYPSIAQDANDDELFQVWHRLSVPDATPDEAEEVLQTVYGTDWEPPKMPELTLREKAEDVGKAAGEIGKGLAAGVTEFGGAIAAGKVAGRSVANAGLKAATKTGVGQVVMAVPSAIRITGKILAGNKLNEIAEQMPSPSVDELRAKGYTDQQIRNIITGYVKTNESILGDVIQTSKEGIDDAAIALANAAFLDPRASWLSSLGKLATKGAGKTGAKVGLSRILGGVAEHGAAGALWGGLWGGAQKASARGAEAAADGKPADEILRSISGGALSGAVEGAGYGLALGAVLGGAATAAGVRIEQSAARRAMAEQVVKEAHAATVRKFGTDFRVPWLFERFADQVKLANEQGLSDEILAQNIVREVHGEDILNSPDGARAAMDIFEKIRSFRSVNEGLRGPMLDLPERPLGAATDLRTGLPNEAAASGIPNRATPTGAPIDATGGVAPDNLPASVQGPIGERTAPFTPPKNVAPMAGVEGPPRPVQEQRPIVPESIAPEQPRGPVVELNENLPIERLVEPPASEIAPRELGESLVTPRMREPNELITRNLPSGAAPEVPEPGLRNLPSLADEAAEAAGKIEGVTARASDDGRALVIDRLSMSAQKGGATEKSADALRKVFTEADQRNLPVEVTLTPQAGPKGGKIPLEKLVPWYEQQGFKATKVSDTEVTMRREPPPVYRQELPQVFRTDLTSGITERVSPVVEALSQPAPTPKPGRWHQTELFADMQIVAAKKRMRKRGVRLNLMVDPADIADMTIIGANYLLKGSVKFAEWSKHMVAEFGDAIKPHLQRLYQKALALYETRRPVGDDTLRQISLDYVTEVGLGAGKASEYRPLDTALAGRIAEAYDSMPTTPNNKRAELDAAKAYKAMVQEVDVQFQRIKDAGINVEFVDSDPYATVGEMLADIRDRQTLKVFQPTETHPFMSSEQLGKFRAVHDFFGHAMEGFDFVPRDTDNAWYRHAVMFSNQAIPAVATETRGQAAFAGARRGAAVPMKYGLLPKWAYEDVITERVKRAPTPKLAAGMNTGGKVRGSVATTADRVVKDIRPVKKPEVQMAVAVADGVSGVTEHLKTKPESAHWYENSIKEMEERTMAEYPDMAANPGRMTLFKVFLAVTSPQTPVPANYARATMLYDGFLRSGKVPLLGRQGQEINVTSRGSVPRINKLLARFKGDTGKLEEYLMGKTDKGVPNAVKEFGPKVGRFFLNLNGIRDEITVDIWMMRWWRRVNGILHETNPEGQRVLRPETMGPMELRTIAQAVTKISEETGLPGDAVQASLWDREKLLWSANGLDSPTIDFAMAARHILRNRQVRAGEVTKGLGE